MQAYLVDLVSNKKLVVVEPKCKIGRDEINDIVINGDLAVSRFHFLIIRENNQYFIDDCQSRHGTFLNGNQVQKREPINDGDVLKVGISLFWFVVESSIEDEEAKVPPVDMNQTISSLVENQKSLAEKPKEENSEPVKLFKSKIKDEDKVLAPQEQVWKADDLLNVLTESLGQDILTEPLVNEDSIHSDLLTKEIDSDPKLKDLDKNEATSTDNQSDDGKLKSVLELVTGNDNAESAKSAQSIDEITIEENLKPVEESADSNIEMDASAQDLINALNLEAISVDESESSLVNNQDDELASLFKDLNDENSLETAKAKEEAEIKAKEEADAKASKSNNSDFAIPHLINQNIEFKAFSVTKDEFNMENSSDININGVEKNMTTSKHVNGKEEMTSENSPIVESYLSKELARLDKVLADYNEQIKQINDKVSKVETRINLTKELRESLLTDHDEKLLVSCAKVLAMLGFDVKTSVNDKQELRLHSKESADAVARVVWTPSKADRSDIGQLSMAQTRYWVESGIEPKGLLIVSKKIDEHSKTTNEELFAELTDYAVKRNVCLLTTIQLLAMYKDVALGAGEPDTIKNTLLDTSGWLPGFEIATTTKSDAKIAVSEEESDKVSVN